MIIRFCTKCNKVGEEWYVFCPHCGKEMNERCGECGHLELVNRKFCLTFFNEANYELRNHIKKSLVIFDKIFSYILLAGLLVICALYYDQNNFFAMTKAVPYLSSYGFVTTVIFLIANALRKKKIIKEFKEKNPKYSSLYKHMGI